MTATGGNSVVHINLMRKAVRHLKNSDPVIKAIIERIGACRMNYGPPDFHNHGEAIVYQQLNGKAAEAIFGRFTALAGDPLMPEGILRLTGRTNARSGTVETKKRRT